MARTTSAAVALIIEVDDSISLTSYIEAANALVTQHCTDTSFTTAQLELIERWLSAWAYALRDKRPVSNTARGVGESYQHVEALGFDANEYGQMAMRLDWSGALSSLNNSMKKGLRRSVGISWVGKELSEQTVTG